MHSVEFLSLAVCVLCLRNINMAQGQTAVPMRPNCTGTGANIFEQHCIVPDVIDQAPAEILQIKHPSGLTVNSGNEFKPEDVQYAPTSVQWTADPAALYTLSESDPDASAERAPINHWLVVNIPGADLSQGNVLMPYRGARPPQGTGLHRYISLIYKQAGRLDITDPALQFSPTNRTNFQIRQFAKTHNLGNPVAGNFYQAQYSDFLAQPQK